MDLKKRILEQDDEEVEISQTQKHIQQMQDKLEEEHERQYVEIKDKNGNLKRIKIYDKVMYSQALHDLNLQQEVILVWCQ